MYAAVIKSNLHDKDSVSLKAPMLEITEVNTKLKNTFELPSPVPC